MAVPLSQIAVPVFSRGLTQLGVLLDKGVAHAAAVGRDPAQLLESRLAPDMFPLRRQVMLPTDFAQISVARIAALPLPQAFMDVEADVADLRQRLAGARSFLASVDRRALDAGETRPIAYDVRGEARRFPSGLGYLLHAAIPHFYFHVTTAYAILRHEGVPLAKADFIGGD